PAARDRRGRPSDGGGVVPGMAGVGPLRSLQTCQRGERMSKWWDEPFRTFQTNLREIDAGLDVDKVADFIVDYGADTWLLSTAGIITNYPSALDCQTVNPALSERASRDLIGDAVAAAQARGIRVLGRLDFSKVDARRAEEYPQWCYLSPEGV